MTTTAKTIRIILLLGFITPSACQHLDLAHRIDFPKTDFVAQLNFPNEITENLRTTFIEHYPQHIHKQINPLITIIDFSRPSSEKRLWTFDPYNGELILHTFAAHGRHSGELFAEQFSNRPGSFQSSLGFYVTGEPYIGAHGLSLRLEGLEPGINDKAFERAIVVHGADYVSDHFVRAYGRLGRSLGCPALPLELIEEFIRKTANGSLIFIWHPSYAQLHSKTHTSVAEPFGIK